MDQQREAERRGQPPAIVADRVGGWGNAVRAVARSIRLRGHVLEPHGPPLSDLLPVGALHGRQRGSTTAGTRASALRWRFPPESFRKLPFVAKLIQCSIDVRNPSHADGGPNR